MQPYQKVVCTVYRATLSKGCMIHKKVVYTMQPYQKVVCQYPDRKKLIFTRHTYYIASHAPKADTSYTCCKFAVRMK